MVARLHPHHTSDSGLSTLSTRKECELTMSSLAELESLESKMAVSFYLLICRQAQPYMMDPKAAWDNHWPADVHSWFKVVMKWRSVAFSKGGRQTSFTNNSLHSGSLRTPRLPLTGFTAAGISLSPCRLGCPDASILFHRDCRLWLPCSCLSALTHLTETLCFPRSSMGLTRCYGVGTTTDHVFAYTSRGLRRPIYTRLLW